MTVKLLAQTDNGQMNPLKSPPTQLQLWDDASSVWDCSHTSLSSVQSHAPPGYSSRYDKTACSKDSSSLRCGNARSTAAPSTGSCARPLRCSAYQSAQRSVQAFLLLVHERRLSGLLTHTHRPQVRFQDFTWQLFGRQRTHIKILLHLHTGSCVQTLAHLCNRGKREGMVGSFPRHDLYRYRQARGIQDREHHASVATNRDGDHGSRQTGTPPSLSSTHTR
jgi:hypothetical protein